MISELKLLRKNPIRKCLHFRRICMIVGKGSTIIKSSSLKFATRNFMTLIFKKAENMKKS